MTNPKSQTGLPIRRILPLAIILCVAVIGFFTLGDYLSFETLRQNRDLLLTFRDQNFVLCVVGFMAIYITIVAFSLPGAAIASLTGGFLFGLAPGTLVNIVSATIGAGMIFAAARYGLGEALSRRMNASAGMVHKFGEGLKHNELSFLFLMRLVPAVPFFAANLIPALLGVSPTRFLFTTFFGIIPGAIVYTWVGVGLSDVFSRGESPNLGVIFSPQILIPILGLSALAAVPIFLKQLNKKES